ncbi:MAG: response regulator [Synergistaceae bacterium]|jgi:signal transduction histidine kinase/CheY-like chemotaxis protein|nr:response regulator [Synergistaceae bacterium]
MVGIAIGMAIVFLLGAFFFAARVHAGEGEIRFGSLLDNLDIFVCVSREGTREILYANKPLMESRGLENPAGRPCGEVFEGALGPSDDVRAGGLKELKEGESRVWEGYDEASDRYYKNIERAVVCPDGERVRVRQAIDITESKRFEERLKKRELDLKEALAGAQRADGVKNEFLSRVSHEIRTPMNAIIGMTKIALRTQETPKIRGYLEKIDASAQQLMEIIDDILDMSDLEVNRLKLLEAPFDFEKMLKAVYGVTGPKAKKKSQAVSFYVDGSLQKMYVGDEMRLSQVILNLMTNAIKFTPEKGNIRVRARQKELREGSAVLEISVEDSGIGISPENLTKIFRPFEQLEGSISRKFGGTGLGLIISKNIVEMMGGAIEARSEEGKGSTFVFTVKLAPVRDAPENKAGGWIPGLEGRRILLTHDAEVEREILKFDLEEAGAVVDCAPGGETGLDLFAQFPDSYDLVLVEAEMSPMDGLEMARSLRAMNKGWSFYIPIVAMVSDEAAQMEAASAGIDVCVVKPVDIRELLRTLTLYLKPNPEREAADRKKEEPEEPKKEEKKPAQERPAEKFDSARVLPFIDVPQALEHLKGNGKLYLTLLLSYQKNEMLENLEEAFPRQDFEYALKNAQALRSIVSNLSMRDLQAKATLLEEAVRGGVFDGVLLEKLRLSTVETRRLLPDLILGLEEGKIA